MLSEAHFLLPTHRRGGFRPHRLLLGFKVRENVDRVFGKVHQVVAGRENIIQVSNQRLSVRRMD
jgi:hypothetical protein